jgi:MFS family permease
MLPPVIEVAPYNFTAIQFGLTRFGTITGTLIALVFSGPFSDYLANWLARRNNGIREAEHRLPLFVLGIIFMPGCLLIFGLCASYVSTDGP